VADLTYDTWWSMFSRGRGPQQSEQEATSIVRLLGLAPGARLLDVPCGDGRLALPLARLGARVTGLDHSEVRLQQARARAEQQGLEITWVMGDMFDLPWQDGFDGALCAWSSFGYGSDEHNEQFLRGLAAALVRGGRLFLETPVLETLFSSFHERTWRERPEGGLLLQERRFDYARGRLHRRWISLVDAVRCERTSAMRVYGTRELLERLGRAGFTEPVLYGGLDGQPFSARAEGLYLICCKGGP
jgi:SAM-dependent methyltransferase